MADSSTPTNNVQVFIPAYLIVRYLDMKIHLYEPSLFTFSVHKDHKVFSSMKVYLGKGSTEKKRFLLGIARMMGGGSTHA